MMFKYIFKPITLALIGGISLIGLGSCKKFLEEKSKISQVIPRSLADLQALLDNSYRINDQSAGAFAELLADNYFMRDADYQLFNSSPGLGAQFAAQNYIWAKYAFQNSTYWEGPYIGGVYLSNIVLDQLPQIQQEPKDSLKVKALMGSALFYRSFSFWSLAQVYCRPYAQEYLSSLGIVLRLTSDAGVSTNQRATVEQTYDRIISDLKQAATLLPLTTNVPTRPCQTAAYAMLSRVYLSMRNYEKAAEYANLALLQRSGLMDYNTIPAGGYFPAFNTEVIYDNISYTSYPPAYGFGMIDTLLYQSYDVNDLRKTRFFQPYDSYYGFTGGYRGATSPWSVWDGLATNELYLNRAECAARAGNKDLAMADLNRLMQKRWSNTVPYSTITASNAQDALSKVLTERRKELLYRGLRWPDIRRFNLDGANITLKRNVLGNEYILQPNDLRTVILIPQDEITRSGIEQNPR